MGFSAVAFGAVMAAKLQVFSANGFGYAAFEYFASARAQGQVGLHRDFQESAKSFQHVGRKLLADFG